MPTQLIDHIKSSMNYVKANTWKALKYQAKIIKNSLRTKLAINKDKKPSYDNNRDSPQSLENKEKQFDCTLHRMPNVRHHGGKRKPVLCKRVRNNTHSSDDRIFHRLMKANKFKLP